MKILQINVVYPGGSTGRIMGHIHEALIRNGHQSIICYGRGKSVTRNGVYKTSSELEAKINNVLSRITGIMYGGCLFSTRKIERIIVEEKPDIVHLHCLNGYFVNIYKLIAFLKKRHIPAVLTLHAEFMYTGNCSHAYNCEKWKTGCGNCSVFREQTHSILVDSTHKSWRMMKDAFTGFENLMPVSVSPWVTQRAMQSPILNSFSLRTIFNGVDTKIFSHTEAKDILDRHGLSGKEIILHVTPEFNTEKDDNKGGRYILSLANLLRNEQKYQIVVIGKSDPRKPMPGNIRCIGYTNGPRELADWYSASKYTVLTSRRETFSMVLAESLCCGTPVLSFKAGGPESIGIQGMSLFYEYGDINGIYKQITNPQTITVDSDQAKNRYSIEKMCEQYLALYDGMLRRPSAILAKEGA